MISSVNYRPKYYAPGYNPIIWSVTSDQWNNTNLYDFKYVFDLFIDGAFINRFKQRPNPSGAGMLDVCSMIDPYLEIGNFANEVGTPLSTPFKTGYDAAASVFVRVGEEYRQGSAANPLKIYTGLVTGEEGDPEYLVGAQGFFTTPGVIETPVVALPISLGWKDQQETLTVQTNTLSNYYGLFGSVAPYIMKNDSIYAASTCTGVGLFLSEEARTVPGGNWKTSAQAPARNFTVNDLTYDRRTLSFINRNPVYERLGGSFLQSAAPKVAWFTFYDSANTVIGTYAIGNYITTGGAPRTACGQSITTTGPGSFSESNTMDLVSLRVGYKDLEELGVWASLGEVPAYYTVQLFNTLDIASDCSYSDQPTVAVSELVTIRQATDCLETLYPRVRLSFLNSLGGRDYWNFTVFAEETTESSSSEYYQTEVNWSGLTPVALSGTDTTQNWLKGGIKQYNKANQYRWTITSDFLTQQEVDLLKGIVKSSQVWAYIGEDDFPYTCKVLETSYTVKTIKQVKLFTATFNIQLSTKQTMQTP